ncbi:NAD(P)H-hydrate dehydratase [Ancylobacter sp. Lp-2]|uniref:NAD(P)H-hydrate dehydratase n=1 Tax=Ancylobacter sp. Lp-2 TaxID=2881339 RepID=UPI001E54DDE0|nr:NAD(P)H-hydrate dehydratase [Ancylobacter sp. Lp-2]MCB4770232.1 NAD(P)H-hydrate dehydratase [Ancylobacter sp. Lp-2]
MSTALRGPESRSGGFELLTPAEMGRADGLTIAGGTPGTVLMERAGAAVAQAAARRCLPGGRVLVLCGPGNNGGDGFVAARRLAGQGYRVRLALAGARAGLRGDAAAMIDLWTGEVDDAADVDVGAADLIVDALFGAGLARDLDPEVCALVERVNAAGVPVVAVDLPSGIDGATGVVRGAAIRALASVTFFRPKPGHLLMPGRMHAGTLEVVDIGIDAGVLAEIRPRAFANVPELWAGQFPVPRVDGHKYTRGHLVAVSGPAFATGATRLAAKAALRTGAGLVTVACPAEALAIHAANLSAVMVRPVEDAEGLAHLLADRRLGTVVLGPGAGVGPPTRAKLEAAAERRLVVDADLITSYAGDARGLARALAKSPAAVVTPHDGEFARLFAEEPSVTEAGSKLERARAGAALIGAVLLLKGPDTVVASPDGRAAIASNAPPTIATAGAGDVLAGIVGGLLAQGMPAFEAAAAAVWLHGEAGREAGPGLVADDLVDALRPVLRRLFARLGGPA